MEENKKKVPKGGSKGGTRFPRLSMDKAYEYTKKLVSKTHTGAQPATVILQGVFGTSGPGGQVRASALKQYHLLEGTTKDYIATDLARKIIGATEEELYNQLQIAFLIPKIFKILFETFQDDEITKAKIRQQASNLKVHPESLDECVDIFIKSAIYVKLAIENGEMVKIFSKPQFEIDNNINGENIGTPPKAINEEVDHIMHQKQEPQIYDALTNGNKSNIEIKIDPSMDPEKLDKLLSVLKKYGQI